MSKTFVKVFISTVIAGIAAFSSAAIAASVCSGRYCNNVKVTRLYPSTGAVYLSTDGIEASLDCDAGGSGDIYLTLERTHPGFQNVYALILTAHETQRPINFAMNAGTGPCVVTYIFSDINF